MKVTTRKPAVGGARPRAPEPEERQATIKLPQAFSIANDQEFFPIQHLMARLNPQLMVVQVATGRHLSGGATVYWGLVFEAGQTINDEMLHSALADAGYDFAQGPVKITPNHPLAAYV